MTQASIRDRFKPVELLLVSGVLAAFAGVIVLMSTRDWVLTGISTGLTFIVSLVVTAMLVLAMKPNKAEILDLQELNTPAQGESGSAH
jgi:membrane protein implicated in regulation of membrane protease activity